MQIMHSADESARVARRLSANQFLAQQFAVNFVVAVVLTLAATVLVFHGRSAVPLWGSGNLAFDLIPSTLLPTIGATMAITKAAGMAIRQGLIQPVSTRIYDILPRHDALAGLVIGLGLLAVLGSIFIGAISYAYDQQPVPYTSIFICKLIYAFCVCIANTPIITGRARARASIGQHDGQTG